MKTNSKIQDVLQLAFEKLENELMKKPISVERVATLTNTIQVISEINPLKLC